MGLNSVFDDLRYFKYHAPVNGAEFGLSDTLIYCKKCGLLLYSEEHGQTQISTLECTQKSSVYGIGFSDISLRDSEDQLYLNGHVPVNGAELGLSDFSIYCKKCGFLLYSDERGRTRKSNVECSGSPGISLRDSNE